MMETVNSEKAQMSDSEASQQSGPNSYPLHQIPLVGESFRSRQLATKLHMAQELTQGKSAFPYTQYVDASSHADSQGEGPEGEQHRQT